MIVEWAHVGRILLVFPRRALAHWHCTVRICGSQDIRRVLTSSRMFKSEKSNLQHAKSFTKTRLTLKTKRMQHIPQNRFHSPASAEFLRKCRMREENKLSAIMTSINVIRNSAGRTFFPCNSQTFAPTNPRAGTPTSGNTVRWSSTTRVVSLTVPRQNPVNIAAWTPQSGFRSHSSPITYPKPPHRASTVPNVIRQVPTTVPCQPTFPGSALCRR